MGGVAPLYYALKGGSYFIHRIFYFFLMRKEVNKDGITVIYMTKQEHWQMEKQICFINFERSVECPLVNHCKWLLEWFHKNYGG